MQGSDPDASTMPRIVSDAIRGLRCVGFNIWGRLAGVVGKTHDS